MASWVWVVDTALLARQLAASARAIRLVLAGIAVGAAVGCLSVWMQWVEGTAMTAVPHYQHIRLFGLHMMAGTVAGLAWISVTAPRSHGRMLAYAAGTISCGGMLWSAGAPRWSAWRQGWPYGSGRPPSQNGAI